MPYAQELKIALEAARAAGELQSTYRTKVLNIETKNDNSPVTQVDKMCEEVIRDAVNKHFPSDGFLGEESGEEKGQSGRTWIVDPLDGTRPYIHGIPTHSVLIALQDGVEMAVGCIYLPALQEIYWASKGEGAFCNNNPLHVSKTSRLSEVFGSGFGFIEKAGASEAQHLLQVMGSWGYAYGFMDAYTYGCIAAGKIDVCVNLLDKPWDCAAAVCIIEEAGGRFSDINGNASVYHGSCILSNGLVHQAVLEYFSGLPFHGTTPSND
jgi:myo-inositol-1(or 4)-monophosphatase